MDMRVCKIGEAKNPYVIQEGIINSFSFDNDNDDVPGHVV